MPRGQSFALPLFCELTFQKARKGFSCVSSCTGGLAGVMALLEEDLLPLLLGAVLQATTTTTRGEEGWCRRVSGARPAWVESCTGC